MIYDHELKMIIFSLTVSFLLVFNLVILATLFLPKDKDEKLIQLIHSAIIRNMIVASLLICLIISIE